MDKSLLVQVVVKTGNQHVRCGTGYPIAPGRIITAAHVINDATADQVEVRWYHQSDTDGGFKRCKSIVWQHDDFDVVILDVECPESLKSRFGLLAESEPRAGALWESEGFPRVGQRNGAWQAIPMKGTTFSMGDQSELFDLVADAPPSVTHGWRGASGSPVFVDGKILGIIVRCPEDFANGRLSAVPVCRLLRDEAFRVAVELSDDQRRTLLIDEAIQLLAKSPESLRAMAQQLDLLDLQDPQKSSRNVIDKLLAIQSPPQILTMIVRAMYDLDKRQSKNAADILQEASHYIVPAALANSNVKQISVITESKVGRFGFKAKTKTFVEIAMARINGRKTEFRTVKAPTDYPPGKFCLLNPPVQGMDGTHDGFIRDFVAELSGMVGEDLLSDNQDENVEAINVELKAQFEINGWQYYYVFEYPIVEAEKRRRNEVASRLVKLFPQIAFIGLDCAETPREELDTVTRMMRILCRAAGIEYKPHGTN